MQKFLFRYMFCLTSFYIGGRKEDRWNLYSWEFLHFAYSRFIRFLSLRPCPYPSIRTRNKQFAFRQSQRRAIRRTKEVKPIPGWVVISSPRWCWRSETRFPREHNGEEWHSSPVIESADPSWLLGHGGERRARRFAFTVFLCWARNQFTPCGIHYDDPLCDKQMTDTNVIIRDATDCLHK